MSKPNAKFLQPKTLTTSAKLWTSKVTVQWESTNWHAQANCEIGSWNWINCWKIKNKIILKRSISQLFRCLTATKRIVTTTMTRSQRRNAARQSSATETFKKTATNHRTRLKAAVHTSHVRVEVAKTGCSAMKAIQAVAKWVDFN